MYHQQLYLTEKLKNYVSPACIFNGGGKGRKKKEFVNEYLRDYFAAYDSIQVTHMLVNESSILLYMRNELTVYMSDEFSGKYNIVSIKKL
jgi:hypothetical protein